MDYYLGVLKKYAVFEGRASRSEYWFFALFNFVISIAINVIEIPLQTAILSWLYALAVLVPSLAVGARRLHDTGRSGWWLLIFLVPILGPIILIIWFVFDSEPGANRYGPNPKTMQNAPVA